MRPMPCHCTNCWKTRSCRSFYRMDANGLPHDWLEIMRATIASVGPQFSVARMLKEYVRQYYVPAGALGARLNRDNFTAARELADWQERVAQAWPQVELHATGLSSCELRVGQALAVQAQAVARLASARRSGGGASVWSRAGRRSARRHRSADVAACKRECRWPTDLRCEL